MTRPELIEVLSFVPGFTTDMLTGLTSDRLVELYSDYFEGQDMSTFRDSSVEVEAYINQLRQNRLEVPEKTGKCLECEEPTQGAFCSADCRDEYERMEKLKTIRGK